MATTLVLLPVLIELGIREHCSWELRSFVFYSWQPKGRNNNETGWLESTSVRDIFYPSCRH